MNIKEIINSIFKRTKADVNNEKRQRIEADTDLQEKIENIGNTLAPVATTGDYNDLNNKPYPANNASITIVQNGIEKGTFTLNQDVDQTIDLQGFTGIDVVKNVGFYKKTWSWNPTPQNSISENDFWSDPKTGKWYYSNNSDHYVWNETTSIWERKIWKGLTNFTADYIWSDNEDIYYSYGDSQYRLNRNTDTWATLNWKFDNNTKFNGQRTDIWFDGEHAYYDTNGGLHYVLDKNNLVWNKNIWSNIEVVSPIEGRYIWTDHENNVYLNRSSSYIQSYKLDKTTNAWISVSWRSDTGTTYLNKNYIWHDNRNTYYSDPSHHYIVNIKNQILTTIEWKCVDTEVNLRFTSSALIFNNKTNNIFLLDVVDYDSLENYYSLENVYEKVFNLEKVAKTGNYDDLLNKPIIEKVNNATINLIQNEDIKGSFNLNQTNNQDIELEDAGKLLKAGKNININYYDNPSKVSSKTWFGELPKPLGRYIWTDGENIYYSYNNNHYVLDKTTSTWAVKTWNGLTSFKGDKVWTDGDNVYINKYKLDKSTNTWNLKSDWMYVDADYIWLYKGIVYYSSYSNQYFLNKETDNWEPKTWTGLNNINGNNIWTDGENCYYTLVGPKNKDYILEDDGETWTEITFINRPFTSAFTTNNIFHIGGNTYVMYDLVGPYKLDKNTKRWSYIEFNWSRAYRNGYNIWSDGKTTYYSSGDEQYKFVFDEYEIENILEKVSGTNDGNKWTSLTIGDDTYNITEPYLAGEGIKIENNIINATGEVNVATKQFSSSWNSKTWTGLTSLNGRLVWTDGENIYYSSYSNSSSGEADNYVLDKKTSTWIPKTWHGIDINHFNGLDIWKDGDNIYNSPWTSAGTDNYVLDKTTSTWSKIIFSGYNDLSGRDIWTDGNNIYNSDDESQYVLDKKTSTWIPKTWHGCTSFRGTDIWTDGENIYYSNQSNQYVLDKETSTWNVKIWNGLTNFYGDAVWTAGDDIYYTNGSNQYVLDKSTSTWIPKTWTGFSEIYGSYIWSDGENIYYSGSEGEYELLHMTHKVTTLSKVAETGSYDDLKYNPIPQAPTVAGTYTLQVVVDSEGNATYSWVINS